MLTEISLIIGLVVGIIISFFFTKMLMKSKNELVKEKMENDNNNRVLELEKEKSQLEERVTRINEMEVQASKLNEDLELKRNEATEFEKRIVELETSLEKERKATIEKLKLLEESKEELKNEFKNLSTEILEEKSRKFTETNKENINGILSPLKEEFEKFRNKVDEVYINDTKDRTALKTQIEGLRDLNEKLGKDALNLTNALKGDSQKQGAWGEVILERVLEESGLHKGREYETQLSFNDEEGKRKRPDAIVHLPNNKDVIIDSKVSIVAYQNYHKTDSDTEREKFLKDHLNSIKTHVKGLSLKNYADIEEIKTLDYVLMFIPIESAFMLAMENDPELFSNAFEKNIVIVTPSTLLVTLKTIQNIWRYEKQNKHAQEIAKNAGNLHDKFVNFTDSLLEIGTSLNRASKSYDTALNRLKTGKGNLISQAQKIKELGVKSKKELSSNLIDSSEEGEFLEIGLMENE